MTNPAPGGGASTAVNFTVLGPVVSLSPASLTFASQLSGTTSTAQPVTLTNTGNAALSITSIAASGDFAETNACGTSLAAGSNCTINVTFKPTAGSARGGTLSVTDNAPGGVQTLPLAGTGEDFSLTVPSGSSSTSTVSPGQTGELFAQPGRAGRPDPDHQLYLHGSAIRGYLFGQSHLGGPRRFRVCIAHRDGLYDGAEWGRG